MFMKKLLSIIIVAALLFSALPLTAFAAETEENAVGISGTTGGCTWELNDYGGLTISGNGAMADYTAASECPWYAKADNVSYIVIESGVTKVGDYAFYGLKNAKSVYLENGLQTIGKCAFQGTAIKSVSIPEGVTEIKASAFRNCGNLKYVSLPKSLTKIGNTAFAGAALDSLIFPNKNTNIGLFSCGFDSKIVKDTSFVVYGYPESTAQTYAVTNGFEFREYDGIERNIKIHMGDALSAASGLKIDKACPGERVKIRKMSDPYFFLTGYESADVELEVIDGEYYFTMPGTSVEVFVLGNYTEPIIMDLSDDEPVVLTDEKAAVVKQVIVSYESSVHGSATRYDLDGDFSEDIEISGNTVKKLSTSSVKSSVAFNTNRSDYSPVSFLFADDAINSVYLDLTLPADGDSYDYTPEVAVDLEPYNEPHYTVTSAHWFNEWGVAPETFEGGQKYFIEFTLTPDDGYAFAGKCNITFNGVPELNGEPLRQSYVDSEGSLHVSTASFYIPGNAHNINIIGGIAVYDEDICDSDERVTEACAGEHIWVNVGSDDIEDGEYVKTPTLEAYSDDVWFGGVKGISFIMPDNDVTVSLTYQTGNIITGNMDLRNGAVYTADDTMDDNYTFSENLAIFQLLMKEAASFITVWDQQLGKTIQKFDLDGDNSYDLAKNNNEYYLLETSSLSAPSGKLTLSVPKADSVYMRMRTLTIIFADSSLQKHKVTVNGGHASTKSDDYNGDYSVTEAYAGEWLYVVPNLSDLGENGYIVQNTSELFVNGQEVGFEGPANFEMPDCDADVVLSYNKGTQIKGVMDLRSGSYTASGSEIYAMSELYGMYIVLIKESDNYDSQYNEQTGWVFRFDVDGDNRYDILLNDNTGTFELLPTSSLDPESGRLTLTIPREESYTIPMRELTIILSGSVALIGDVNNDGTVDVLDAMMIQKYTVDKVQLSGEQLYVADVNNDGIVDILDAMLIQKYAVDKIDEFPKKA